MKYIVTLNGNQYEVEVERGEATAVYTGPAPAAASAPVAAPAPSAPVAAATPAAPAGAGEPLNSPLPGTVLEVNCAPGQAVKAGEILFILEAMKMENEICAPRDGTVTAVQVGKGSVVETDAILCTLA